MRKILINESQLKRLVENNFEYGLDFYENNYSKFENQVKTYHSQVSKFCRFCLDLSVSQILDNPEKHRQIFEQSKLLLQKIKQSNDKLWDIGEIILKKLKDEDEDNFTYQNPLYKKYKNITSNVDDMSMDLDDMIEIYEKMIDGSDAWTNPNKKFMSKYIQLDDNNNINID